MQKNGFWDPNLIFSGQKLIIPLGPSTMPTPLSGMIEHTVAEGDSLAALARKYRTTPSEIRALNPAITDPDHLTPGTMLTIEANTAPPVRTHRVRPGESLSQIAAQYGVTTQSIVQANGLQNPNNVQVGRLLIIPEP